MRFKFVLILGAIAALVIVATGCGGGSDSTSSGTSAQQTTPTEGKAETTKSAEKTKGATGSKKEGNSETKVLTPTEFATRVNETCIEVPKNYEAELKKLQKGGKKPSKQETTLKAAIPPLESAIENYKYLTPPPAEAEKLEKMISAMESAIAGLEADPTAELSGPKSPFAEFQKVSKEFGFQTCEGL